LSRNGAEKWSWIVGIGRLFDPSWKAGECSVLAVEIPEFVFSSLRPILSRIQSD
jgi:hypothetical protein